MTKRYFLIDDEAGSEAPAEAYAEEIAAASDGALLVVTTRPGSLSGLLEFIASEKPDGLLVDVAFTNALSEENAPIPYDGIALAQQIRTLQTRGLQHGNASLPEFPLIRFSKEDVIREYVSGDTTSNDLFDEKIDKAEAIRDARSAARVAVSLATDYPKVADFARGERGDNELASLLGCATELLSRIDARALLGLRRDGNIPSHILSRYLISALLSRSGSLIDEALLAVRFGVDHLNSSGWPELREELDTTRYLGTFSLGYVRWWMPLLIDWWESRVGGDQLPYRLSAKERVDVLSDKTGITGLEPLRENADSPGTRFWYRCLYSQLPVDPAFGFPLMPEWGQESWQDVDYLCQEEALRHSRDPRIASSERTRLVALLKERH